MKILITLPNGFVRDTFITPRALELFRQLGEVKLNPFDRQFTGAELHTALQGVTVAVTGWGTLPFDEQLLAGLEGLKIIAQTGGSVGNLVTPAVYTRGIRVLSTNIVYADSVAEACLAYTMMSLRQLEKYTALMRSGGWKEERYANRGLFGKTVGLVGYGAIGSRFRELLRPFTSRIYVNSLGFGPDEARKFEVTLASLETIFESCDIISLHLPLLPQTRGLIGRDLLARIKPGALFLNTARGAIVDEAALTELLAAGRFNAALDVFTQEPLPADSPLRSMPNVLLIPHMAGPTIDMRETATCVLIRDVQAALNGEKDLPTEISAEYAAGMTQE
jgi:phosphoglycerate dehydrogenase-like enzyme